MKKLSKILTLVFCAALVIVLAAGCQKRVSLDKIRKSYSEAGYTSTMLEGETLSENVFSGIKGSNSVTVYKFDKKEAADLFIAGTGTIEGAKTSQKQKIFVCLAQGSEAESAVSVFDSLF